MLRQKRLRAETKVLDADAGTVTAVVSTETKDRDGDIIRARGWNLERFLAHPVLLSSHSRNSLTSQIGEWTSMELQGQKLVGTAKYYIGEGNPEADWGFKLASKSMAAFSVGFIPDMDKAKELEGGGFWPNYEFNGQELIEASHVTVPSNPEALQKYAKSFDTDDDDVMAEIVRELIAMDKTAPPPPEPATTVAQEWLDKLVSEFKQAIADEVLPKIEELKAIVESLKQPIISVATIQGNGDDPNDLPNNILPQTSSTTADAVKLFEQVLTEAIGSVK